MIWLMVVDMANVFWYAIAKLERQKEIKQKSRRKSSFLQYKTNTDKNVIVMKRVEWPYRSGSDPWDRHVDPTVHNDLPVNRSEGVTVNRPSAIDCSWQAW